MKKYNKLFTVFALAIALAKAEAEALEIRGKALKENQDLIRLQAIEKWDGKAPQTLILGDGVQSLINMK